MTQKPSLRKFFFFLKSSFFLKIFFKKIVNFLPLKEKS